jgi:hypothetical protein
VIFTSLQNLQKKAEDISRTAQHFSFAKGAGR